MSRLLTGKEAVVTGSSGGIGREILTKLASNGANIWACCRSEKIEFNEFVKKLEDENGVKIRRVYFDLSNEEEIKKGLKIILSESEKIDILVNNAGMVSKNALFQMTSIGTMKNVFEVNFFSQMLITQYILKKMLKQKNGSIVNIASIAGIDGKPGQMEYGASKAALISATKTLANELSIYGIRVNAVAPGVTETSMIDGMDMELLKTSVDRTMMKRVGKPEEIAEVVSFLASEKASYITGQILRVDGGIY